MFFLRKKSVFLYPNVMLVSITKKTHCFSGLIYYILRREFL